MSSSSTPATTTAASASGSTPAQLLEPLAGPQAGDPSAVAAAVHGFTDQVRAAAPAVGDYLWDAFHAVFAAAGRTPPERQGPLVEFLTRLRQTTAAGADGQPLRYEGGEVWRDMPSFGWVARDLWNFDVHDRSASAQDQAEWENWTALLAQLTAQASSDDDPRDPFDFSLFALWAMRAALEEQDAAAAAAAAAAASGPASAPAAALRQAAIWIRYAGARIRKLSAEGRALDGNMGAPRGKYADRGWRGFNEERWAAWKDEMRAAQRAMGGTDNPAAAAVDLMDRL